MNHGEFDHRVSSQENVYFILKVNKPVHIASIFHVLQKRFWEDERMALQKSSFALQLGNIIVFLRDGFREFIENYFT